MRFDVMTLFPGMVDAFLSESIIRRARDKGIIEVNFYNIRDFTKDIHKKVDDTPYGGGKGMLLMPQPVYDCHSYICGGEKVHTIYLSPKGKLFNQKKARELKDRKRLVLLCGHYEGIDQRVLDEIVDEEISIGDYVLTGGELGAAVIIDCVSRLVEGVLSDPICHENESLSGNLLEYPQYTRPFEYHGKTVPEVLISGHHANIEKWRKEKALEITLKNRPELLTEAEKEGLA